MSRIDENKRNVLQILSSLQYEVDEVEDMIFASKYCEAEKGGLVCLMVECCHPFDKFKEWSGLKSTEDSKSEVSLLVDTLNGHLSELIRASGPA